jgi:restriction system protein
VPVILLIFLGVTGIMTVIAALVRHPNARPYLAVVLELIASDEILRQIKAAIKNGSQGPPKEPVRSKMPEDKRDIQEKLLAMDPYVFESHVMSFFMAAGMIASVTQKSNDEGVDGFARHPQGLILVQCKRYGPENLVGGPAAQQFWGVVLQHEAWRGYFVTTSQFTAGAVKTAELSKKIVLVDMNEFVRWHQSGPRF